MTVLNGVEYITTPEAIERLGPDVTADTIRGWVRTGKVNPAGRNRARAWIFRWDDLVDAEHNTRESRFGRPRQVVDGSANMTFAGLVQMSKAARKS